MQAFADAVRVIFADPNMTVPAVWQPRSGQPVPLRAIIRSPDQLVGFGAGQFTSATMVADVMVADAPTMKMGDRLIVDGATYEVQAEPVRDYKRLVWSLNLRPERG